VKILGLSCGRKMGNSELLLRDALEEAEKSGVETEIIRLGDLTIKPCTGCESCVGDMFGGGEGACVQKGDHMAFLFTRLAEADAIVLSVPTYTLMPPGLLLVILDRALGAGKTYKQRLTDKPKIGAIITVGGTDWVNLVLPLTNLSFFRLFFGNIKIVDQMLATYIPRPGQVLLHEENQKKAREIGQKVAHGLSEPYDRVEYSGSTEESCPLCHNNLLKIRGKFVECPICDIVGTVQTVDGRITVTYDDEELAKSRFGSWGMKKHTEEIMKGHKEYFANKSQIEEKAKRYRSQKRVITPPPLK
jgi:multimeric flavodoxin WrbA